MISPTFTRRDANKGFGAIACAVALDPKLVLAQPQPLRPTGRIANMPTWTPDPTFYPSPRMAMKAPAEQLAYVAAFDPERKKPDGIAVVDVDPSSSSYSKILGTIAVGNTGDEFHHFGWNACSSCLCPQTPHPHVERRYL